MTIKILLLEDNADDAELVIMALSNLDAEVQWASSENEYLDYLSPEIDIILSDFTLPGFNAIKALEYLEERELDIPFIMVTGSLSDDAAGACIRMGAADYLHKDRLVRLESAVKNALHEKQLREEKRQAELALRISEEKFRTIFEEALDVILILDRHTGKIIDANFAVERLLGYHREDILEKSYQQLLLINSTDLLTQLEAHGHFNLLLSIRRKDGTLCPMDVSANFIPWEDDRTIRMNLRDATDRENMIEAVKTASTFYNQMMAEKELREVKSRFVSMVSHEFRNPMASIQLQLDILKKTDLDEARRQKAFTRIQAAIHNMTALIEDVLTLGKAEEGWLKYKPEWFDLHECCEDIVEQLTLENHHLVFSNQGMATTQVHMDKNLIRQIVTNLLGNAIKYSDEGSKVELCLLWEASQVSIRISDEGRGISQADLQRLFQPFHRGENVGSVSGTGLGLAITKQAVELHGGKLAVESEVDKGSTFTATLPLRFNAKLQ